MRLFGVILYGLRDPYTSTGADAQKPVLFCNAGINVAQLPAEFATYKILPILEPGVDPGENWTGDTRGGLGSGGVQSIDLPEDTLGSLGMLLQHDPKAPYWLLKNAVIEEDTVGNVDLYVNGRPGVTNAPAIGSIYWIEGEAFYAGNVVDVSSGSAGQVQTWRIVASRAHCGSYQERHEIDPAAYGEGSSAAESVRLLVESKPNFQAHTFKGAFISWRLPVNRNAVATEIERRYWFLKNPPDMVLKNGKFFYRLSPTPIAEHARDWRFSATPKEVPLENRLQVVQLEEESTAAGYVSRPKKAKVALSRLKTELLFRHALHNPPAPGMVGTLLGDLWTRIQACRPMVDHRIVARAMGTWVFTISSIGIETVGGAKVAVLDLDLVAFEAGASLSSAAPGGAPPSGYQVGGIPDPTPPFESGWAWYMTTQVAPGEDAPTLELRWAFECQPIEAALILLLSRGGGTGGAYDKMIGRPLALPTSWVNTGAVVADPTTLDLRTKELLQLNQLLNETIVPQFKATDTVGKFLRDLNLFYLLLFCSLSSGKVTLRRWATSAPTGLSEIIPEKKSIDVGQLLDPLRALRLLSGINEVDLSPQFGRTVTLGGAVNLETLAEAVELRIWQPGNVISDDALKSEAFSVFFRALFSVLGGQPRLFSVETSLEQQQFDPGDVVQWTDKRIPTPEGIGFENVRFLVVGKDVNFQTSIATYRLLRDYYNETSTTEGKVAPCLLIDQVIKRNGVYFTVDVKCIGDQAFDVVASADGIYASLAGDFGRARLFFPMEHNPIPTDEEERPGYLECSVNVFYVAELAGAHRMILQVDADWERGGFTRYDLIRRGARLYLTDRRDDDHNPEGVLIEPYDEQLYADGDGLDFAKWGETTTFDRNYTLISDVP